MKIRPVVAELFHADGRATDGQTDMTKLIVAFRSFADAPNNSIVFWLLFKPYLAWLTFLALLYITP